MKPLRFSTPLFLLTLLLGAYNSQLPAAEAGDKNGVCDCEEGGLKDIPIKIYTNQCGGTPLQTVSTDEKGNFTFESFDPGTYFVMVDLDYVCGGRVPTTSRCQKVQLEHGETVDLPAFGYSELGQ